MSLSSQVLQQNMKKQSKHEHYHRDSQSTERKWRLNSNLSKRKEKRNRRQKEPDQNDIQHHLVIISRLGRLSEPWQVRGVRVRREKRRINRKQRWHKQLTFLINPRWKANREEDSVKQTATTAQDEILICIQGTRGTEISGSLEQWSQCWNRKPDIFLKGHLRNKYVCTIVLEQKEGCVGFKTALY